MATPDVTAEGPAPTLTLGISNFAAPPIEDGWQALLATARDADRAGVDRLAVVDHVVMGSDLSAYDGARFPTGADGQWLEPLTVLSVVAGQTTNIRLSTGILIAALRPPAVLAKTVATLDVLSGGRVDLGVGVGWQRKEYEAVGLPFEERGRLLDESLAALSVLWGPSPAELRVRGGVAAVIGTVSDVWCEPKPFQTGGVPIWVSGRLNPAVLRRMVRFGNGWIPWGEFAADVANAIPTVRNALAESGRDQTNFGIRASLRVQYDDAGIPDISATMQPVPALRAAGANDFGISLAMPTHEAERQDLLGALVDTFRSAAG